MNKLITISLVLGLSTVLLAKPNIPNEGHHAKLAKMAGEKGIFAQDEVFPKDYFLINKNLPFSIGLTLHHPESSTLALSKEQIAKLLEIKGSTLPIVIKLAKEIKAHELTLTDKMIKGAKASEMDDAVEHIAKEKVMLTKAHLKCIEAVRNVLDEKQRKTLLGYASKEMKPKH